MLCITKYSYLTAFSSRADAKVELRCGGGVVARATTRRDGSFEMEADAVAGALGVLVGACRLVVDTPRLVFFDT